MTNEPNAPVQNNLDIGGDDAPIERSQRVRISTPEGVQVAPAGQRQRRRQPRDAQREPQRPAGRGAVVLGRNGEELSRKRTGSGDIFAIPAELIPKGWEYQWVAFSVVGNTEILMDQNLMMAENGWRPVPADRYPGRFMPQGHKGNIVRGGQMLMERPTELCKEARAEEVATAKRLITDRDQSLMGGKANLKQAMQGGFEMNSQRYRGTGGDVRMTIDPGLDIPAPSHQLANPED